jgi:hypothetical protein
MYFERGGRTISGAQQLFGEGPASVRARMGRRVSHIAFGAGVLLVGLSLAEAFGVVAQARGGPKPEDWALVRARLERDLAPEDGVVLGARWLGPVAREAFGDGLMTPARAGGVVGSFARVAIVGESGALATPEGYVSEGDTIHGGLALRFAHAARPFVVGARLPSLLGGAQAFVDANGEEIPCSWGSFGLVSGNLGSGPAWPSERFSCAGAQLARSFVTDLDYAAHDAIFADVPGDGRVVVARFPDVAIGTSLRGGFGLYVEAEREGKGAPVILEWRVEGRSVGTLTHHDGDGWKSFELTTGAAPGARGTLEMRLRSPGGQRRLVGVDAVTITEAP